MLQGEAKMLNIFRKLQLISLTVSVTAIAVFGFGATAAAAAIGTSRASTLRCVSCGADTATISGRRTRTTRC